MNVFDGGLDPGFRMIISGSSATGKSTLVHNLLLNNNGLLSRPFQRIIYLRGVETKETRALQELYGDKMIVFDGIPSADVLVPLCKVGPDTVLVIEDLDQEACSSTVVGKFFTAYAHHHGVSIILSTQNMFCPGRERLTLVRNATHLVLFPNYLDLSVIRTIAQRVYPQDPSFVVKLFEQLTREPFGYLSIWGNGHHKLKFRSHITGTVQKVYEPK